MIKPDEKPVLNTDPDAAQRRTVTGWVSRQGHFYGDNEQLARWDGCTHIVCACGTATPKGYTKCEACRTKAADARYLAMPLVEWDNRMFCIFDDDRFFGSEEEFVEWCEDEELDPAAVQLVACESRGLNEVDPDYWSDELPEDGELPGALQDALDVFNAAVRKQNKKPSVWWAINQRITLPCQIPEPGDEHIKYEADGWYFYDEIEDKYGPFPTKDEARAAFKEYCEKHP